MKKDKDKEGKKESKELQEHLKEKFQAIEPNGQVPEELKKGVFDSLDTINLMADFADLFTAKFTMAESEMIAGMESGGGEESNSNKEEEE